MVRITLDLVRKRAEHNEGEISTLEEIALHQENIDKIDTLNVACRNLKILLMQNNLIARIENLNMLKRLEYLNLALNNIQVIENLEGLESLRKLDLTINFVANARDVERLRRNENLEILYLTGNPCTDYDGYREYVLATLPELKELDSTKIERSERIKALQNYARARDDVTSGYRSYIETKSRTSRPKEQNSSGSSDDDSDEEARASRFWSQKSLHTPEERVAIAEMCSRRDETRANSRNLGNPERREKPPPRLSSPGGTPYNVNRARIPFSLDQESDPANIVLEIRLRRFTDPSHVNAEVGTNYARVTVKGKLLQVRLPCEVSIDRSVAERNTTTGRLLLRMPRLEPLPYVRPPTIHRENDTRESFSSRHRQARREHLEIGPPREDLDFSRIYRAKGDASVDPSHYSQRVKRDEKNVLENFVDDPTVPPLE